MSIAQLSKVGVLTVCLAMAGCSVSGSTGQPTVNKSSVEQSVKDVLTQQVGQTPKSVTCVNDLNATVGASERCTLTATDGSTIGLTVTVTSVDNGTAKYDVKVDTATP